jgi:glucosyl-dolichyl phosphate glucuronosyltransferase
MAAPTLAGGSAQIRLRLSGMALAPIGAPMHLDLLIPTFQRPALLRAALSSVARATPPRAMTVAVTVINNDAEPLVLEPEVSTGPYPLRVLHERRHGKSAALNAGIAASTGDYIGLIDDDEEIAADWFLVVERALEAGQLDFIGGRAILLPSAGQPTWLPPGYPAVLGSADNGPDPVPYGPGFEGLLMGGNAVISRSMLRTVGPYSISLGPRVDRRLSSCEDEDMYLRLIDAGARGRYLPELVVHHYVHPERLRKSYYRSWCFWNGASKAVLSRRRSPHGPQLAGVPRYVYGDAFRGVLTWLGALLTGGPAAKRTAGELPAWHLAGRLYGRFWQRDDPRRGGADREPGTDPAEYGDGNSVVEPGRR